MLGGVTSKSQEFFFTREERLAVGLENLHIALMGRFCKFQKNKTVNCNMQGVVEQAVLRVIKNVHTKQIYRLGRNKLAKCRPSLRQLKWICYHC